MITLDRLDALWSAIAPAHRDTPGPIREADGGTGDVYQQADQFRRQLLALDLQIVDTVLAEWERIKRSLMATMEAIEKTFADPLAAADDPLYDRLGSLLDRVAARIRDFTDAVDELLAGSTQVAAAQLAGDHVETLTALQLGPDAARVGITFDRLSTAAVEQLIAQLQSGPVRRILAEIGPDTVEQIRRTLIDGLTLGLSPRDVGRQLVQVATAPRHRLLTIARTETLRAYREAARRNLTSNSHVVKGWRWSAALDTRTCPVCWAMHGTEFPADEIMATHPNCRCAMAPVTRTFAELGIAGVEDGPNLQMIPGEELFARQPARVQLSVLGPAKYAAYRDGTISLADLVGVRYDSRWGPVRFEKSLAAALEA